ncbi:MAG: hypothetical protein KDD82_02465 [Planctomycetes bacterium]|nr:hypothetical protein [Planctomycetota bacterium]
MTPAEAPRVLSASTADLRSLAATRIGVAGVLLYDLLTRLGDFGAHYTEAGALPLALVPARPLFGNGALSLHLLATSSVAQGLLFAAALLAALALLVGHHTRRATWVSWWLLVSLQARNPHVLYEADVMLGLLLLWGALLPWGQRWSLDARGRPAPPLRVSSPAVLGVRLQTSMALLCALLSKSGDSWRDGSAVGYVLRLDVYTTELGRWLGGFPRLSPALTWGTLALELFGPVLVFARGRWRWVGIGLLAALQLGFGATLHLGIFPAVFLVALLPFVPTRATRVVREPRAWVGGAACALILLSAAYNAAYLVPALEQRSLTWVARTLHVDQGWGMFAPDPMTDDGWLVIPARLADGREVDLLQGGALRWGKPASASDAFGGDRWKELLMAAREAQDEALFAQLLNYFVARWDAAHPEAPALHARLVWVLEETLPAGEAAPTPETLARWRRPSALRAR